MKSVCNFLLWFVFAIFKCAHSAPYGGFARQEDAVIVEANPTFQEPVHNPVFCRHQVQQDSPVETRRNYYQQTNYQRNTPQTYLPYTSMRVRNYYYTSPQTYPSQPSVKSSPSYHYQRQTYSNAAQESRSPPMATPYFPRKAVYHNEETSSYLQPQVTQVKTHQDVLPSSSYFVNRQNDLQENIVQPATSYLPPKSADEDVSQVKCSKCIDQAKDTVQEDRQTSSYSLPQIDIVEESRNVVPPSSYSQVRESSARKEIRNDFGQNSPTGSSYEAFMMHQEYPTARVVMGYRLVDAANKEEAPKQPTSIKQIAAAEETDQPLRSSYF